MGLWTEGFNACVIGLSDRGAGSILLGDDCDSAAARQRHRTPGGGSAGASASVLDEVLRAAFAELEVGNRGSSTSRLGLACWAVQDDSVADLLGVSGARQLLHDRGGRDGSSPGGGGSESSSPSGHFVEVRTPAEARRMLELARAEGRSLEAGRGSAAAADEDRRAERPDAAGGWRAAPGLGHVFVRLALLRDGRPGGGAHRVSYLTLADLAPWGRQEEDGAAEDNGAELPSMLQGSAEAQSRRRRTAALRRATLQQLAAFSGMVSALARGQRGREAAQGCLLCQQVAPLLTGNVQAFLLARVSVAGEHSESGLEVLNLASEARRIKVSYRLFIQLLQPAWVCDFSILKFHACTDQRDALVGSGRGAARPCLGLGAAVQAGREELGGHLGRCRRRQPSALITPATGCGQMRDGGSASAV